GHKLATGNGAARGALALAAGKDAQQTSRCSAGGRGEIILANVNHPGASADRKPAQRDDVAGIELALGKNRALWSLRHRHRERGHANENRVTGEAVGAHEVSLLFPVRPPDHSQPAAGRRARRRGTLEPASWPDQGDRISP